MSPSKIFFYFCLIFITSVFLASFVKISQPLMLGFFILGLALIAVFWEKKKIVIAGFYILFFLLGFWRYQQSLAKIIDNQFPINEAYNEKAIIVGSVLSEPDIRISNVKLVLKGEKVIIGNKEALFSGKVLITSAKYPEYKYGDKLKVTGKISLPPVFEDFNYKDYLAKQGIQAVIYYPDIELLKSKEGSRFYANILAFKNHLAGVIGQNLPPPQSFFLEAILFGSQSKMPQDLKDKLNITGLRHLTAVSGMNKALPI